MSYRNGMAQEKKRGRPPKDDPTEAIPLRFPRSLAQRMREAASNEGLTLNKWLSAAAEQALAGSATVSTQRAPIRTANVTPTYAPLGISKSAQASGSWRRDRT